MLSSYDVTALFTSVPVDPALGIIKDLLEKDSTLKERTLLLVMDIILLLEFCLKNTYFLSKVSTMKNRRCSYGSPVSSIVANLYMEYFEQKALSPATPQIWLRYVDNTWVVQGKKINKTSFNMLIVLTWPLSLEWKPTRRMRPSPSWTPMSNQRLMVGYHHHSINSV